MASPGKSRARQNGDSNAVRLMGERQSPIRIGASRRLEGQHPQTNQLVPATGEQYTGIVGEIIPMSEETHLAPGPKSLADILAEELDGELGDEQTQELPVTEKQARLKAVYERIHQEQPARSALCLSGGGIRSAIFGLGILQ